MAIAHEFEHMDFLQVYGAVLVSFPNRGTVSVHLPTAATNEGATLRSMYARLAHEYDKLPRVADYGGGLPGELNRLQRLSHAVPDRLYLPPVPEISQGDIYRNFPTIHLESRPLRIARLFRPGKSEGEPDTYGVHLEEGGREPKDGFKLRIDQGGEYVLARTYLGMAILLSHDCEIDNDDRHRLAAPIRPLTDLQEEHRPDVLALKVYSAFPLEAQDEEPKMALSFVDFRRVTTVRPAVLDASERYASISVELRKALAQRFWLYLHRPQEEGTEPT